MPCIYWRRVYNYSYPNGVLTCLYRLRLSKRGILKTNFKQFYSSFLEDFPFQYGERFVKTNWNLVYIIGWYYKYQGQDCRSNWSIKPFQNGRIKYWLIINNLARYWYSYILLIKLKIFTYVYAKLLYNVNLNVIYWVVLKCGCFICY